MKKHETDKERFIRVAREHGCDETGDVFMEKLKTVLSAKPTTQAAVQKKAKKKK
jgi:hypothetical protein